MKVYNLQCQQGHGFEGWFSSEDDYDSQQARGLLTCPVCDNAQVRRMPTAPRLNLSHPDPERGTAVPQASDAAPVAPVAPVVPLPSPTTPEAQEAKAQMLAAWLHMAKHVVDNTEDVGTGFAQEASKMHHGEVPERAIRGRASPEEKQALREEGIEVAEMLIPAFLTKPLQ